jgi:hypothetical protein
MHILFKIALITQTNSKPQAIFKNYRIFKNEDLSLLYIVGRGGEIRTPTNGFGDRDSTLKLRPYKSTSTAFAAVDVLYFTKNYFKILVT